LAAIESVRMMLEHLGEEAAAKDFQQALIGNLTEGKIRTADLGGSSKTHEVGDDICRLLLNA